MDKKLHSVRFPIGVKLVAITSILVLASLGSITALVSWLVSQDLRITAEDNNFEVNRRLASETENHFLNMISNSLLITQTMRAAGVESALANDMKNIFFERNRHIAAIAFTVQDEQEQLLVSERFFLSKDIEMSLAHSYSRTHGDEFERAATGETLILNAAPHFASPLLALFFPLQDSGGGAVIFSAESMNENFGSGTNQSFLINGDCDLLIHSDYEYVRAGINLADRSYVQSMRENPLKNMQTLYDDEDVRYFGAFTKLNTGDSMVITSIEYDTVFEGLAATTRRNAYLTAAVLCFSILFIWFFSKSISVPLRALANAANTIEGGIFKVELQSKGGDEIGLLTNSFQRMSNALGIFGKFTNRDLAIQAMRGELKPGGLPKHATIFFSDVRDFTGKSEMITEEFESDASDRIVFWLNSYLTKMVECIEKTGGIVDKFIGDGVMAHWGTAYTTGNVNEDALNCIKTALLMRTVLVEMNSTRDHNDKDNPPITIGCGINSGVVTAGQIGSDLRMEYTVIGDPVNIASRIEGLNKPLGTDILITGETWELVKDHVMAEEMPSVHVKGKEKSIRLFAVINLADSQDGPRTLNDVRQLLGLHATETTSPDIYKEEKYKIDGRE